MPTLHAPLQKDLHVPLSRLALEAGLLPIAKRHAELAARDHATDARRLLLGRVRLHESRLRKTRTLGLPTHAAEAVMDPLLGQRLAHAQTLVEAGELELARAACLATLSAWPAAVRGWLMLACIDAELEQWSDAAMSLEQSLRWQPHHAAARRMLRALPTSMTASRRAGSKAA